AWIRPNDSADATGAEVIDAGGATIVPAMVDCHSHLTMQGGSHWIQRGGDPPAVLRQVARENANRLAQAGTLWTRDVGAPAAEAGVDSIEHGMELTDDTARAMKRNNVTLVTTLSVFASWETFGRTTTIDRFTAPEFKTRMQARKDGAYASLKAAKKAGVTIATGSDFGGGSVRAGHLAWEVELLVGAGLEPYEALAAATRNGGALYGVDHAGRLDEGTPADLVPVHGDPLS